MKTESKEDVIAHVKMHGNVSRAARQAGVNRRTVYRWASSDIIFNRKLQRAIKEGRLAW